MKQKYWIGLSSVEQIDSVLVRTLYEYFGDIERAFNCSKKDFGANVNIDINPKKLETFLSLRDKIDLDKTFDEVERRGINVLTYDDACYPKMLKEIHNPPIILYYKGDLFSCNLERTVAFVGSRRASSNGKDSIKRVIGDLKNTDICIVSGLAEGIDAASHRAAIDNNLKTIGVIASGFDFKYPASNKDLYEKLENGFGAVVTEYYPTVEPIKFHFPQRNRIVTGLSYGTVVAEASLKSGALISANLCLEQGRELMCIPGLISNPNTEGIYKLLKNGATLVTCADDILNALNWEIKTNYKQMSFDFNTLSEEQTKIIKCIECEPKNFDMILNETQLNADTILINLTELEINGYIKQIEGEKYQLA